MFQRLFSKKIVMCVTALFVLSTILTSCIPIKNAQAHIVFDPTHTATNVANGVVLVHHDLIYFLKEFIIKPIVRKVANIIQNKIENQVLQLTSKLNGKNAQFVTNWRSEILNSIGQGNDVFRTALANVKFCPYFDQQLKQQFGADKYTKPKEQCVDTCVAQKGQASGCNQCVDSCFQKNDPASCGKGTDTQTTLCQTQKSLDRDSCARNCALQGSQTGSCDVSACVSDSLKDCVQQFGDQAANTPACKPEALQAACQDKCSGNNLPDSTKSIIQTQQCTDKSCYQYFCSYRYNDQCQNQCTTTIGEKILIPGTAPFQVTADCGLSANFNPTTYARDFAKGGGWSTWAALATGNSRGLTNYNEALLAALQQQAQEILTQKEVNNKETQSGFRPVKATKTVFSNTAAQSTAADSQCLNQCLNGNGYPNLSKSCEEEKTGESKQCTECINGQKTACELEPPLSVLTNEKTCDDIAKQTCTQEGSCVGPSIGGSNCTAAGIVKGDCERSCQQQLKAFCGVNDRICNIFPELQSDVLTPGVLFGQSAANAIDSKLKRFGLGAQELTDIIGALLDALTTSITNTLTDFGDNKGKIPDNIDFDKGLKEFQYDPSKQQGIGISPTPSPTPTTPTLSSQCDSAQDSSCGNTGLFCSEIPAPVGATATGYCAQCDAKHACPANQICQSPAENANGTPPPPGPTNPNGPGVCVTPGGNEVGAYCLTSDQCKAGLKCGANKKCKTITNTGGGNGTGGVLPSLGLDCSSNTNVCKTPLFCSQDDDVCVECDEVGKSCSDASKLCVEGVCTAKGGNPASGPCRFNDNCQNGFVCGPNKTCVAAATTSPTPTGTASPLPTPHISISGCSNASCPIKASSNVTITVTDPPASSNGSVIIESKENPPKRSAVVTNFSTNNTSPQAPIMLAPFVTTQNDIGNWSATLHIATASYSPVLFTVTP